jgi:hypothetical protein
MRVDCRCDFHLDIMRMAGEAGFKTIRVNLAKMRAKNPEASSLCNYDG